MYKHYIGNRGGGKTQAMTQELMNRCNQLEKALDKACCVLDDYFNCPLEVFNNSFPFCKEWDCEGNSEGCWRKWLMMEGVQEDD